MKNEEMKNCGACGASVTAAARRIKSSARCADTAIVHYQFSIINCLSARPHFTAWWWVHSLSQTALPFDSSLGEGAKEEIRFKKSRPKAAFFMSF
jgi:hypothetical protein